MARFSCWPLLVRFARVIATATERVAQISRLKWFNSVQTARFFTLNVPCAGTNLGCLIQINFVLAFAMYNIG